MRYPMQPLERDQDGVVRFQKNMIVRHILDVGKISLNDLSNLSFDDEDWMQFAQLIGYSVDGFSELTYVSDDVAETVRLAAEKFGE